MDLDIIQLLRVAVAYPCLCLAADLAHINAPHQNALLQRQNVLLPEALNNSLKTPNTVLPL